ncbi:MAG: hypothetical protein WKG01_35050 [Kofleriaceae bacterium]
MLGLRLLVLTFALTACGGNKKPATPPMSPEPTAGSAEAMPADGAPAPEGEAPPGGGPPVKSSSDPCMGGE